MYVGLFARLAGFERDSLTRALERRTVVQGTSLRATIHLVSPAQWWSFAIATREARRDSWLRGHRNDPSRKQLTAAARRVRARLSGSTMPRKELQELVALGAPGVTGINVWLDLVRVPPSGTWERRRADVFALAEDWLGQAPGLGAGEAATETVRAYLRGFGPADRNGIASWSGLPLRAVDAALANLELRRFRAEDGVELVDLPRAPLPDPETPAPVRFLPTWDATLLTHCRRTAILPEKFRSRVFNTKTPQSTSTFTVDGAVAGTWRFERGNVEVQPFRRLSAPERHEVEAEVDRLAAFHRD
jgi:hypothetical protein